MKIRKGDNVLIIAGKDKGKKGLIQQARPQDNKVMVTGLNLAKHHLKPSRKNPHGGIIDMPAPIDASNVLVLCPHCSKPTKVSKNQTDKTKERVCRKCQGNLDAGSVEKTGAKEKNVKA